MAIGVFGRRGEGGEEGVVWGWRVAPVLGQKQC